MVDTAVTETLFAILDVAAFKFATKVLLDTTNGAVPVAIVEIS